MGLIRFGEFTNRPRGQDVSHMQTCWRYTITYYIHCTLQDMSTVEYGMQCVPWSLLGVYKF